MTCRFIFLDDLFVNSVLFRLACLGPLPSFFARYAPSLFADVEVDFVASFTKFCCRDLDSFIAFVRDISKCSMRPHLF